MIVPGQRLAIGVPRQHVMVRYRLDEVLLAVLAGADTITDIARFGEKKLALLPRFLPFADGTPSLVLMPDH